MYYNLMNIIKELYSPFFDLIELFLPYFEVTITNIEKYGPYGNVLITCEQYPYSMRLKRSNSDYLIICEKLKVGKIIRCICQRGIRNYYKVFSVRDPLIYTINGKLESRVGNEIILNKRHKRIIVPRRIKLTIGHEYHIAYEKDTDEYFYRAVNIIDSDKKILLNNRPMPYHIDWDFYVLRFSIIVIFLVIFSAFIKKV